MVIGRVGQSCALAAPVNAANSASTAMIILAIMVSPSLRLDAGGLDDRRPHLDVVLDELRQILGLLALGFDNLGADLAHALPHRRRVQGGDRGGIKLLQDRRRRALW